MPESDPRRLQALLGAARRIDALLETVQRRRLGLVDAMRVLLPEVCAIAGAQEAFVRTFSEDLTLVTIGWSAAPGPAAGGEMERYDHQRVTQVSDRGDEWLVLESLDVAGEWFGTVGLTIRKAACAQEGLAYRQELLHTACEQLDNYLQAIRASRDKHRVIMRISDALRHRVLGEGLRQAVGALAEAVPLDRLLLVCEAGEQAAGTLHVQLYRGADLELDTMGALPSRGDEAALRAKARALLRGQGRDLLDDLGVVGALEELLINGIVDAELVGKVFVTSKQGGFNTQDRELLASFAGFIRQRVVDFHREWRTLARSFRPADVARLLRTGDYATRWLSPREATVAMLYADIDGFTELSERVLKTPSAVGELVAVWSQQAVQIVWDHGGVFDKMVGDCVIALFGPPFYDEAPGERLLAALRCARAVRDMTRALPGRPELSHLSGVGLGVAIGVNLAPLFVGRFGVNENFTGFSSGMNNTARLQGCADRDEILVMSAAVEELPPGHGLRFGPERSAKVKNVADPIRFRPLA